jgi:hydrogenase expression/formation protein HypE
LPEKDVNKALEVMKNSEHGKESKIIGKVTDEDKGLVTMKSKIGAARIVDMLSGEQLPRIC